MEIQIPTDHDDGSHSVMAEYHASIDMRHEMKHILANVKSDLASISAWKRQGFEMSHEQYLERAKTDHFLKSKEGKASRRMEERAKKKEEAKAVVEQKEKEPVNPFDKPTPMLSPRVKVPLNFKAKISGMSGGVGENSRSASNRQSVPVTLPMSPTRAQVSATAAKSRGLPK
jgi:hypothetical protein